MQIGDIVRQTGEEGIVVCIDPLFMRLTRFHCYVAITDPAAEIVGRTDEPVAMPSDDLVERIRRYLSPPSARPTGD